ncbi:hypothetical protein BD770DRAFT_330196 [Pilaira anomala]|nr:hypothetical protein BD770DRAFT_330196 [Pilaira anomala]
MVSDSKSTRLSISIILHQIGFLVTGLCTTLGVQWLFYRGAATSMSLLPQLSNYTGMLMVGLFIPVLLKRKRQNDALAYIVDYFPSTLPNEEDVNKVWVQEDGPIDHFSVIKLAALDIISSFALTIGFSVIGTKIQWIAIIGTSVGLGVSSLDSMRATPTDEISTTKSYTLLNGTIMTLVGTFISACIYVYADSILSKSKVQPLPARVCYWMGVYTSIFTWIWLAVYTLPQFHEIIQVDKNVSTAQVLFIYFVVTVANALHSWSYYELIERTGNVTSYLDLCALLVTNVFF